MEKRHVSRKRSLTMAVAAAALSGFAYNANAAAVGLTLELVEAGQLPGAGKSINIAGLTAVTLDVYATVTGTDGNLTNDGLQIAEMSFKSTGPIAGSFASDPAHTPSVTKSPAGAWDANGHQSGTQVDLDADLDLDIGSNDNTNAAGFWIAISSDVQSSANGQFKIGTITFQPTALNGGAATTLQLTPRSATQGALWFQDALVTDPGNGDPLVWSNDKNPSTGTVTLGTAVTLTSNVVGPANTWASTAGGTWGTGSNWGDGNVPGSGASVTFAGAITAPSTVTVDGGGRTVGGLTFANANKYTLAGSTLTLNGAGAVDVTTGSHDITAPIALAAPASVAVGGSNVLTVRNLAGAQSLTKTGTGTLTATGAVGVSPLAVGAVTVSGGTLKTEGATASTMTTVSATGTGEIDVNNGGLIVTGDTVANVRSELLAGSGGAGFGSQTWDQPGINSSFSATDPLTYSVGYMDNDNFILGGKATFDGVSVPGGAILVKSTLAGDADLDWDVDDDDVTVLGIFYGQPGHWYEADFDYTGTVDDDDVTIMGITYGQSLPGAPAGVAAVPEPASLGVLAGIAAGTILRRRRNR